MLEGINSNALLQTGRSDIRFHFFIVAAAPGIYIVIITTVMVNNGMVFYLDNECAII